MKRSFRFGVNHLGGMLILTTALVLTAINIITIGLRWREMTAALRTSGELVSNRLVQSLQKPLWDMNNAMVKGLTETEMAGREVHAIIVLDAAQKERIVVTCRPPLSSTNDLGSLYSDASLFYVRAKIAKDNDTLGWLDVFLTRRYVHQALWMEAGKTVLTVLLITVLLAAVIRVRVSRPLAGIIAALHEVAQGNLTVQVSSRHRDEVGELAESINTMVGQLGAMMREISANADQLGSASASLSTISAQMTANAETTHSRSDSVATISGKVTTNVSTIARTANEMSSSVRTVAAAVEEMSASIGEMAKNCEEESRIAQMANAQAQQVEVTMKALGDSAKRIGTVVEMISGIADQTNLLALNATIEAASAGEAGKGFAVVAKEVKELAKQSAQATEQITQQIGEMQAQTIATIKEIHGIREIISKVSALAGSVASTVEEQSATTNEIAGTVSGVSDATAELAKNVQEAAQGSGQVSENIQGINLVARQTLAGSTETQASAHGLASMATRLRVIVAKFKV